jgi:shikimate dehydrogenase
MIINKDTQLCISLASRPSNFGTTLHNAGYTALGLNFLYKAVGINDLTGAIAGVRALNIRGCSVSMPFKETVLPLLDELDETARAIGAVNTIVNEDGKLSGYNTDTIGAYKALESINVCPEDSVLLIGAGGVARAILLALKRLGFSRVCVTNRDTRKIEQLNSIMSCEIVPWNKKHRHSVDILINATSIGMNPDAQNSPMGSDFLRQTRAVMDVVVSPIESRLIYDARSLGKEVVPGYMMSLEQAIEQFRLYTGEMPPRGILEEKLKRLLGHSV